jgi:molybdopterin-guanine dinucleotide biosynthesis protein
VFWCPKLRVWFYYKRVSKIEDADYIIVEGFDGKTFEICKMFKSSVGKEHNDSFVYRFIKFEFNQGYKMFVPVIFQVKMTHQ